MIYSPGIMQLPLINARASGDGDTKLPPWPREREFTGLVVAATLGSGVPLYCLAAGGGSLSRADRCTPPCRPPEPLPRQKSVLSFPSGLHCTSGFPRSQGSSETQFSLDHPPPPIQQNPGLSHSHSSAESKH